MSNAKKVIILIGDILLLYTSLMATLALRYPATRFQDVFADHLNPFTIIFAIWLIIFYINDLYKDTHFKINYQTVQKFLVAVFISVIVSIICFYLLAPLFELTPKTNLFLFAGIFILLDLGWRLVLAKFYKTSGIRNRLLIIGSSSATGEILEYLNGNPQLGYDVIIHAKDFSEIKDINEICETNDIDMVVIQPQFKKNPEILKSIYKLLASKVSIMDSITFYEMIFQKLAFEEMDENWFVEKIIPHRPIYTQAKKVFDFILSAILLVILLPLTILIAILINLTSKGPVIYKQERIGLNNKAFILYKFRTMIENHSGPFATAKDDNRITPAGKFLRYTHLDEIPQLFNIIKGNISFIGPRAEAVQLVEIYKQLPYYDLRHIIKPGLTGWAQINYKASSSLEEAKEKLRYDIYYIKNRSLALDFFILLKTIKYFFTSLR